jgi:hypothetical protein
MAAELQSSWLSIAHICQPCPLHPALRHTWTNFLFPPNGVNNHIVGTMGIITLWRNIIKHFPHSDQQNRRLNRSCRACHRRDLQPHSRPNKENRNNNKTNNHNNNKDSCNIVSCCLSLGGFYDFVLHVAIVAFFFFLSANTLILCFKSSWKETLKKIARCVIVTLKYLNPRCTRLKQGPEIKKKKKKSSCDVHLIFCKKRVHFYFFFRYFHVQTLNHRSSLLSDNK